MTRLLSQGLMDSTEELARRPDRAADYARESRALRELARAAAQTPEHVLETLAQVIAEACRADAAGITMLEEDHGQDLVRWSVVAGAFPANVPPVMPRRSSPCQSVIERRTAALLRDLHQHHAVFASAVPLIKE